MAMSADDVQAALDQRVGPVDAAQDRMRETAAAMQRELEALKQQHARLLEEHRILNDAHKKSHATVTNLEAKVTTVESSGAGAAPMQLGSEENTYAPTAPIARAPRDH